MKMLLFTLILEEYGEYVKVYDCKKIHQKDYKLRVPSVVRVNENFHAKV